MATLFVDRKGNEIQRSARPSGADWIDGVDCDDDRVAKWRDDSGRQQGRVIEEAVAPAQLDETPTYHIRFAVRGVSLDCIYGMIGAIQRGGGEVGCLETKPVEMGHRACSTCLIHDLAMVLKRKLCWDPTKERFKNDDEANRMLSRPQRALHAVLKPVINWREGFMITRRDAMIGLLAMPSALNGLAVAAIEQSILGPTVFNWNDMKPVKTKTGEVRSLCKSPTATLDQLEMHVTTLNPGETSHPPHRHLNEELIVILKGDCETLSNGNWVKVGPGSVVFNASNSLHGFRNIGATPATYYVINWSSNKDMTRNRPS